MGDRNLYNIIPLYKTRRCVHNKTLPNCVVASISFHDSRQGKTKKKKCPSKCFLIASLSHLFFLVSSSTETSVASEVPSFFAVGSVAMGSKRHQQWKKVGIHKVLSFTRKRNECVCFGGTPDARRQWSSADFEFRRQKKPQLEQQGNIKCRSATESEIQGKRW